MAYSSSVKRAQVPKCCELCEEDTRIKWRCVECNMSLCDKCKKLHTRVQMSVPHEIVDIKTPLHDVQPKLIVDNIPCHEHKAKMTCLFCRNCDHLVCPDCVAFTHKQHNFEPIEEVLPEKLDELKGAEEKYCNNLTLCQTKSKEIQDFETKCDSLVDETIEQIKQKEQNLIDDITKYSKNLQNQAEFERKNVKTRLSDLKGQTNQAEENLEIKKDEVMAALASNKSSMIFASAIEIKKKMPDLNFKLFLSDIKQFVPKKGTVEDISCLFGSLEQKMKIPQVQSDIDFEVVNSYTTDLSRINNIITVNDKSTWINNFDKQVIRQINLDNDNITTTKQISCKINNMTLTSNNDILLSGNSSDIKLLTKSGEIKPFLSVSPLFPWGIHVTSDNYIIVGVTEGGNLFTPTHKSTRALLIFGMDGKQQHTYQYDSNKHRLFTLPYRITTNNNKDIVVVDRTSDVTGRMVVVGSEGVLRWTYTGHSKINVSTQFDPIDVVTTTAGHIIVSDYDTHALHVLSGQGNILTCKVMKDMGIKYPRTLNLDMKGQLWVGCGTGGKQSGAKIHMVNLLC